MIPKFPYSHTSFAFVFAIECKRFFYLLVCVLQIAGYRGFFASDAGIARRLEADKSSLVMRTGDAETVTLTATYADGTQEDVTQRAQWSTDHEEIAYVRDGTVRAYGSGEATITAEYGDKSVSVVVHVDVSQRLEADRTSLELRTGDSEQVGLTMTFLVFRADPGYGDVCGRKPGRCYGKSRLEFRQQRCGRCERGKNHGLSNRSGHHHGELRKQDSYNYGGRRRSAETGGGSGTRLSPQRRAGGDCIDRPLCGRIFGGRHRDGPKRSRALRAGTWRMCSKGG